MIKLNRPSTCAQVYVSPETNVVTVQFKTGSSQTFTGINSGDIENLLNDTTVSVGKWINQICLGRQVLTDAVAV